MTLSVALASANASTPEEAFAVIEERRNQLQEIMRGPRHLDRLEDLEPELRYEPELAAMALHEQDHEVRGRRVFGDLLGSMSFIQVAAFEIAGLELSDSDAELLGKVGVLTQLADRRIWPLSVTRRIAAHGGGLARSLVGGVASFCTDRMAVLPVAGFMRFLDRVDAQKRGGREVGDIVDEMHASGEKVLGIGRPALGHDERVAPQMELNRKYGRDSGASIQLALEIDQHLKKGLRVNSAGFHGALSRDLGFSPDAAAAFSVLYFLVPVLAHAVYPLERARAQNGEPRGSGRSG